MWQSVKTSVLAARYEQKIHDPHKHHSRAGVYANEPHLGSNSHSHQHRGPLLFFLLYQSAGSETMGTFLHLLQVAGVGPGLGWRTGAQIANPIFNSILPRVGKSLCRRI